jgi:ABC-2 type transport system permease protein
VFYPVSVLPHLLQPVAFIVPASHVFEGMRTALLTGAVAWNQMGWALLLNAVWLAAASLLFAQQFRVARSRGALLSIGE